MKILLAILTLVLYAAPASGQTSDAALRRAMQQDASQRDSSGKLPTLTAAEHLARAETYMANRLFPQAREHWQKFFDNFPDDAGMPKALFGTARSYMWERQYQKAVFWFEKLNGDKSKDGREGLAFKGASLVRMGKNVEAAKVYEQYVRDFPQGERIESAHLNIIDALREAGDYTGAIRWIGATRNRFGSSPTSVNALHAHLRMELFRENWRDAVVVADSLLSEKQFSRSMTSVDEVTFLKALALEKSGNRKQEAIAVYESIPNTFSSYYGGLAAEKLAKARSGARPAPTLTAKQIADSPVMFRSELLAASKRFDIDPRFLLAIMKQESSFRPNAKSPAGARGLLQLVFDTAIKYKTKAGFPNLQPDQLYSPSVNIAIGAAYVADLKGQFGGLYEAIAASYNGGEDNAARWLNRSKPKEPGIFASEVGFAETKHYVFKVMNNYRIYRELYTENLTRR